jgi:hypothetical protein
MSEQVSSIRGQRAHLGDQSENDLRLSDDAIIGLAGSREEDLGESGANCSIIDVRRHSTVTRWHPDRQLAGWPERQHYRPAPVVPS